MNPVHCPKCGRFMANSGSTGASNGVVDWDIEWGDCSVHGHQDTGK